jgi:hypothetical protein
MHKVCSCRNSCLADAEVESINFNKIGLFLQLQDIIIQTASLIEAYTDISHPPMATSNQIVATNCVSDEV